MNRQWIWLTLPLVFLFVTLACVLRGTEGEWHGRSVEFWKERKWNELTSLAINLNQLNRPDPEVFYLAAFASIQLNEREQTAWFASRFLEQRIVNWNQETALAEIFQPSSFLHLIRLYRTRAVVALLAFVSVLNLLCLWKRYPLLPWSAACSLSGIAILLI